MNTIGKIIIAHRGGTRKGSENNLFAFRNAITAGADMIEFDVHSLADGNLVVFHDDKIADKAIKDISSSEFHEHCLKFRIEAPTVSEALKACAGRIRLMLELKDCHGEEVVQAIFNARIRTDDYMITSFNPECLMDLRSVHSGIQLGLLTENLSFDKAADNLAKMGADFWLPDFKAATDPVLSSSAKRGIPVVPWTVNSEEDLQHFLDMPEVWGIITDDLDQAIRLRRGNTGKPTSRTQASKDATNNSP